MVVPIQDQSDASECVGPKAQISAAAQLGLVNLGIVPSGADRDAINATAENPRNWRCRPPTNDEIATQCGASKPIRGRCQFQARAESVLAEPDELRVVPFTSFTDYAKPGLILFLASFVDRDTSRFQQICSPVRNPEAESVALGVSPVKRYYNRAFAGTIVQPFTCVLPPKMPPFSRTLRCPCSADDDCARGDRCATSQFDPVKTCQQACNANLDCEFDLCYSDIHLCGGGPCNGTTLQCPTWEHCVGYGVNQTGTCKR